MEGNHIAVVNFNHSAKGLQIQDLYFFLRKVMEKHDWNVNLGKQLIDKYNMIKKLSDRELSLLQIMMSYPEKFWKIANFYYNTSKAFISERNLEKLEQVIALEEQKEVFLEEVFQKIRE